MTLEKTEESGERFRTLLQRALRGDDESAWQLIDQYGSQLLHLLMVKRREGADLRGEAPRLVAHLWEFLRSGPGAQSPAPRPREADEPPDRPSATGPAASVASGDAPTVGLSSPGFATVNSGPLFEGQPSLEAQLAAARARWKHLLVTPEIHKQILLQRLRGATIAEIATDLGLAELAVKYVLEQEARREGKYP